MIDFLAALGCRRYASAVVIRKSRRSRRSATPGAARLGILTAVVFSAGCLLSDPGLPATPIPLTCGNGVCDVGSEDCVSCPSECACCSAISSVGSAGSTTDPENAAGSSDGKFAILNQNSALILTLGREVYDGSETNDLSLVGEVTSAGTADSDRCAVGSNGEGVFEVRVSSDGAKWYLIGFWTSANADFNLGCADLITSGARYLEVRGQPGASGRLDAVKANTCLAVEVP